MAVIQINNYMLRHEGQLYKAGDTVELSDDIAEALVGRSNGAFTFIQKGSAAKSNAKRRPARIKK